MTDNHSHELLGSMVYYLRDIASHFRRDELTELLPDAQQRLAYELSDGKRSAPEIRQEGGIKKSERTIQNWWTKWIEAGIAERTSDGKAKSKYTTAGIAARTGE